MLNFVSGHVLCAVFHLVRLLHFTVSFIIICAFVYSQVLGNSPLIFPTLLSAVSCGTPPAAPANGHRSGSGTTYQSTRTYTCNPGYSPTPPGPNTITCMANGQWSGSAPRCDRKLPYLLVVTTYHVLLKAVPSL